MVSLCNRVSDGGHRPYVALHLIVRTRLFLVIIALYCETVRRRPTFAADRLTFDAATQAGSHHKVQRLKLCTIRTQSARCTSRLPFHLPGLGVFVVRGGATRIFHGRERAEPGRASLVRGPARCRPDPMSGRRQAGPSSRCRSAPAAAPSGWTKPTAVS